MHSPKKTHITWYKIGLWVTDYISCPSFCREYNEERELHLRSLHIKSNYSQYLNRVK